MSCVVMHTGLLEKILVPQEKYMKTCVLIFMEKFYNLTKKEKCDSGVAITDLDNNMIQYCPTTHIFYLPIFSVKNS